MALPQLDEEAESGVSGNYTLMDYIKSVEWVKENIAAFGGDPDNITLGGQSGGTDKAASFFMSEQGASLVNNVIWQTGLNFDNSYDLIQGSKGHAMHACMQLYDFGTRKNMRK